jgi:L-threonylcarbamoyladenylate synthase
MAEIIGDINLVVKELLKGKPVALPTETVYGLAANALNPDAVLNIYKIKNRPQFNPLIVHIKDIFDIEKYAIDIPEDVIILADKFSPGPLTFVLKKKSIIPDIVTAGLDTVALRIPAHKLFLEVLKKIDFPLAAPSANMFGKISPTTASEVQNEVKGKVKYILDGGKCNIGIESTVIDLSTDKISILRPGFITKEQIESVIGREVFYFEQDIQNNISSPGMLKSHYAPASPLYIYYDEPVLEFMKGKNYGFLDFSGYKNVKEIAVNLFSDLRKLDTENYEFILAKKVKDTGLGVAINDRLSRASKGTIIIENEKIKFVDK